jgi:hypothetical protein
MQVPVVGVAVAVAKTSVEAGSEGCANREAAERGAIAP